MRKTDNNNENISIGLLLRYEIINMIYKNPQESVKIPSSAVLAKKFGTSQRTVTRELKKLADNGYVYGKQGIGVFTEPRSLPFFSYMPGKRIIGILVGDSRLFCLDYSTWVLTYEVGLAMLPDIGHPRNIVLSERSPELMYKELILLNLDGIVWILPPENMSPYLEQLNKDGVPVVSLFPRNNSVSCVGPDLEKLGVSLADCLTRKNKTKVIWGAFDYWRHNSLQYYRKRLKEHGLELDDTLVFENPNTFEKDFEDLLEKKVSFDAIHVRGEYIYMVIEMLKKYGIDPYKDCLLISEYGDIRHNPEFKGLILNMPLQEMAQAAVALLSKEFDRNKDSGIEQVLLEVGFQEPNQL